MSDFTYDTEDFSGIRAASTDLKNTQNSALIGALIAVTTGVVWNAHKADRSQPIWRRVNVSALPRFLVVGGIGYSIVSFWSGSRYERAAATINRKYTSIISQTIDYSQ